MWEFVKLNQVVSKVKNVIAKDKLSTLKSKGWKVVDVDDQRLLNVQDNEINSAVDSVLK